MGNGSLMWASNGFKCFLLTSKSPGGNISIVTLLRTDTIQKKLKPELNPEQPQDPNTKQPQAPTVPKAWVNHSRGASVIMT